MNPMQMMFSMFSGNPMFQRAQEMSKGKSADQIEETCRNICKQRGFDYDQMKQQFEQRTKGMMNMMSKR